MPQTSGQAEPRGPEGGRPGAGKWSPGVAGSPPSCCSQA